MVVWCYTRDNKKRSRRQGRAELRSQLSRLSCKYSIQRLCWKKKIERIAASSVCRERGKERGYKPTALHEFELERKPDNTEGWRQFVIFCTWCVEKTRWGESETTIACDNFSQEDSSACVWTTLPSSHGRTHCFNSPQNLVCLFNSFLIWLHRNLTCFVLRIETPFFE